MALKSSLAILCLFASVCTYASGIKKNEQGYTYVKIPHKQVTDEFLIETGFIRDHKFDIDYSFGYLPKVVLDQIDLFTSRIEHVEQEPKVVDGYHNYDQLTEELQAIADNNPEFVRLFSAGASVNGRQLWYVKISDNAQFEENEPKLLYIANMHGDEVVGREMMIKLIHKIVDEYSTNSDITNLVNNSQIYIMPSMNPDGFENGSRFNNNYSDLNRDFPDFITDRNDTTNGREPETAAIMKLHKDHHFVLALNYHGGDVCFNLPWDTKRNRSGEKFEDDPLLSSLGRSYANANPTMVRQTRGSFDRGVTYGYEWYRVTGGMQDWADYYRRSVHATVELSFKKWPSASSLQGFWEENKDPMMNYLLSGRQGIHLSIPNAQNDVFVTVNGRKLRYSSSEANYIHRVTLDGTQSIKVESEGYDTLELNLNSWEFEDNYQEVLLVKKK